MTNVQPMVGSGRYQWSTGAWFGSQCGATMWLLLGVIKIWGHSLGLGIVLGVIWLVLNLVGLWIWRQRFRLAPYPAYQILLGLLFVGSTLAVLAIYAGDAIRLLDPRISQPRQAFAVLALFPAMMLLLHMTKERKS